VIARVASGGVGRSALNSGAWRRLGAAGGCAGLTRHGSLGILERVGYSRSLWAFVFVLLAACESGGDDGCRVVAGSGAGTGAGAGGTAVSSGAGGSAAGSGAGLGGAGAPSPAGAGGMSQPRAGASAAGSGGRGPSAGAGAGTGGRGGSAGAAAGAGGAAGAAGAAGSGTCTQNIACKLTAAASTGDVRQDCVDRINQFRTQCACLPALARWTEAEACADMMAQHDSMTGEAHSGFTGKVCTPGGQGQNECPGYKSETQVIGTCLQQMWSEGPPPQSPCNGDCFQTYGHFINMTNTKFKKVACGLFTTTSGSIWAVQNFSP
jgi:Cysteine-rich secretory protein family